MSNQTPLSVAINTTVPGACLGLASMLEARGMTVEILDLGMTENYQVTYRTNLPLSRVAEVVAVLDSAQPESIYCDKDQNHDVIIHLTVNQAVHAEHCSALVEIATDTEEMGIHLTRTCRSLGFQNVCVHPSGIEDNTMECSEKVPEVLQALIQFKVRELGSTIHSVRRTVGRHRHHGQKIRLEVRDSRLAHIPPAERYPVMIRTDDRHDGQKLADILAGHGFHVEIAEPLSHLESISRPLRLVTGPMSGSVNRSVRGLLIHSMDTFLRGKGIDLSRYPIEVSISDEFKNAFSTSKSSGFHGIIDLPSAACLNGTARSRGGAYPDRFDVKIITDCIEHSMVAKLKTNLAHAGFTHVLLEESHTPDTCRNPLVVRVGSAASHPEIQELIRSTLAQVAEPILNAGFPIQIVSSFPNTEGDVYINLPLVDWENGTLQDKVSEARGTDIRVHCEVPDDWKDVITELESWGFDSLNIETSADAVLPDMHFGGAPIPLLDRITALVESKSAVRLPRKKLWGDNDDDIFIYLPTRIKSGVAASSRPEEKIDEALLSRQEAIATVKEAEGPFVRLDSRRVQVGSISLRRQGGSRHPLAPALGRFGHFCLDQKTAQTLQHVAISVLMNEPCLLEGETSTSKTSTIEYLAALLGQPLVRINLNGQTDTGELLGRFVPNDASCGPEIPASTLALRPDLLDTRTAEIVQRAIAEKRELSEREREKIAALEGIPRPAWRWQDGLVIQALKQGWWLLLDEVNLAESQILERLNSLLEAHPSLVLTEHSNEVFGDKGTPIHPSFRIFGTMNPAEYAGRSVLSPAYKDRWRGFRQVPGPSEPEYLAMLRLMVFGIQPAITLDMTVYPGSEMTPSHPGLDSLADIEEELKAFARFHASMESASREGSGQLGLRRKERPVFTRRSLLSVLDYIERVACPEPSTPAGPLLKLAATRYYMDRVAGSDDRQVVSKLLEASGLGMGVRA